MARVDVGENSQQLVNSEFRRNDRLLWTKDVVLSLEATDVVNGTRVALSGDQLGDAPDEASAVVLFSGDVGSRRELTERANLTRATKARQRRVDHQETTYRSATAALGRQMAVVVTVDDRQEMLW
jgi:hypothetical protein